MTKYEITFCDLVNREVFDRSLFVEATQDEAEEIATIMRLKGYTSVALREVDDCDFLGNRDYEWWQNDGIFAY